VHRPPPPVRLVVAAWRENLTFVEPMVRRVPGAEAQIYCAGGHIPDSRCHNIPNYGNENYAYLKHIVDHYDNGLADITVFTLGSVMKKEWGYLLCRKLNYVLSALNSTEKQQHFRGYTTMAHFYPSQRLPFEPTFNISVWRSHAGSGWVRLCPASARLLQDWYRKFISANLTDAQLKGIQYNSIFAVSRDRIKAWPRQTYEGLLREIERCGTGVPSVAGHFMERSWKAMLDLPPASGQAQSAGPNWCPIQGMIHRYTAVAWPMVAQSNYTLLTASAIPVRTGAAQVRPTREAAATVASRAVVSPATERKL